MNDVRPDAAGVARLGVATALAFTGLFTVMNLAYVPLIAAGRTWQGVDDYLATWHWTEFGPQAVGLVALPVFALLLVTLHRAAPADRATFSLAGLLFGFAFVAIVWVGYVVQVAWLGPNLRAGVDTGVELLSVPAAISWLVLLPVAALHIAVWFHRLDRHAQASPPARVLVSAATRAGQQA